MAGTQTEFWEKLKSALEVKINRQVQSSRALRRRLFDLHTIFEISKQLNSLLDLEQLLDAIVSTAAGQTEAASAAIIMQASHQNDRLGLLRVQGLALPEKFEGIPVSGNLVQVLLNKNKPLFFSELEQVLASGSDEIQLLQILGCELCLPVISKNKILGILCLGPKTSSLEYHQSDLEFLSALVNNLAVTLENARLYESIKSANQEVHKTQIQLAEKEKLAALGELAASLAHEINNPLGIINNYLTLLENENRQTPEALEHIQVSKQELKRVSKTIKQLLNLYLPQKKEEFRQTDLAGLLNHTLDLFETELQENQITLQREIPASAPTILAREEELRQVFLNLLMNSRDFTPPGGTISVHLRQSNGRLQIEFTDTGVGIPEGNFNQLFRPFFTTKPTGKGTGLGLSISQRIVQDHKGAFRVKNVSGGGASFTIQLPLS